MQLRKRKGRVISVFLVGMMLFLFVLTPFCGMVIQSAAASLDSLRSNFPQGSYWNHAGTSYATYSANRTSYNLRSTSTPCNHYEYSSNGTHCSYGSFNYSGACGCNSFDGSTQCMGFARFVGNYLFGQAPNGSGSAGNGWSSTNFNGLQPGDYIRYKRTSSHYGHSVIVASKSSSSITVLECNYDGKCGISWTRSISKSTLDGYYSVNYLTHGGVPVDDLTVDTRYPTPFKCRIISTSKVQCYNDAYKSSSPGYIYPEDDCVITAIYTNGLLKCDCPWSDGSTKTVYIDKTAFINSSMTPSSMSAPQYAVTYLRSDGGTSIGWIDPGDSITKVATSGSYTQIVYPASVGKRCAWVATSALSTPSTVSYPTPFLCRIRATEKVPCYNDVSFSSSPGYIYVDDDCTITALYTNGKVQCQCPWTDGTTKTVYVNSDVFFVSTPTPVKMSAPKYAKTYLRTSNTSSDFGWIDVGDTIYKLGTSGNLTQVIYPNSYGQNRCAWAFTSDLTESYVVSYNANGGSGAPGNQTKTYNVSLTLSTTIPTRTGYTFKGWSTSASATTATYGAGGVYTNNAAATLYAVWSPNQYNISYDANGGTGAPAPQTKSYGVTLTLSNTNPTRTGHTFLGWSTTNSAETATYAAGGAYTANSSATLYAVWKANTYTISYNVNGGVGSIANQTKTFDQAIKIVSNIPTRIGYIFQGWDENSTATSATYTAGDFFYNDANTMLYAVWSPCSHTWDDGVVTIEPTETEPGEKTYTCTICNASRTESIPKLEPTYMPGDINGDNIVNNKDLTRLMKFLAGEVVETNEAALDVNGDGNINNKDLTRLMKYLAGEDVAIY